MQYVFNDIRVITFKIKSSYVFIGSLQIEIRLYNLQKIEHKAKKNA